MSGEIGAGGGRLGVAEIGVEDFKVGGELGEEGVALVVEVGVINFF